MGIFGENRPDNEKPKNKKFKSKIPKYCPHCEYKLELSGNNCPNCGEELSDNFFTIYDFLRENGLLFTIMGVIGTFTALLPSVAKIYYNIDNLSAIPYPQNFLLLASISLNSLLILYILTILLLKSFESREKEYNITPDYRGYHLKCGDIERIGFYFGFILPFYLIILFLMNIFSKLSEIIAIISLLFLIILLFWTFTTSFEGILRKIYKLATVLLIVLLIMTLIQLIIITYPKEPQIIDNSVVYINSDAQYYSPLITQSIGIGLTPTNTSDKNTSSVDFYWKTDYGYFINWNPSENRVILLGNSTTQGPSKIYWTYNSNDEKERINPVKISLNLKNRDTSEILINRTLNLNWKDNNTLKVV